MTKKLLLIILPLFAFILVACFGGDVEQEVGDILDDLEGTQEIYDEVEVTVEEYEDHNPTSAFENSLREKLDSPMQTYLGYSEVVTRGMDETAEMLGLWNWGYKLESEMTKDDYIALDEVFAEAELDFMVDGDADSFESYFDVWPDQEIETILGSIEVEGNVYMYTLDFSEEENILWIDSLAGTF